MKRKYLVLGAMCSVALLGGCSSDSSEDYSLSLDKVEIGIDSLTDGKFSLNVINTEEMTEFEGYMEYIYDFQYEELFKLNPEYVDANESSIKYSAETGELLAVIKATEGSNSGVESSMGEFCANLEGCEETSFDDYLMYVSSSDNSSVITEVKNAETPIFNNMMMVDDEMFESMLGIDPTLVDEYLVKVPMMVVSSSSYIIVKPSEGNFEKVEGLLEDYMKSLEDTWEMYLPDQYELVKNRLTKTYGDYLIYIISTDNELVYNKIINE
ncbi:MAG: DUF4358 domain-containing protein [bacterium]